MKTSRGILMAVAFIWALSLILVHAQQEQSFQAQPMEGVVEEDLAVMQLLGAPLTAEAIPRSGTFFMWQKGGTSYPPLPFNPFQDSDLPVYSFGTNQQFLVDDRSVDYVALQAEADMERASMMQMSGLGPPGFDEIGTNWAGGGGGATSSLQIFTNGLWLEITSANSNLASLKLHGTEADILYHDCPA